MRADHVTVTDPTPAEPPPDAPALPKWHAALLAAGVGAGCGLVTAAIEPRGPITTLTGLTAMALALAGGIVIGWFTRRRWPLWLAAVAYAVAVEAVRWNLPGPTTDDFRLDSVYAVLSNVVTRGFHGLLAFLPMGFGVALGAWLALRRRGRATGERVRRPIGAVVLGVLSSGLAVAVAWPASTPPVVDASGAEVPGSITELTSIDVGSAELDLMIRAADPDNPVLLYLSGGPGQSDLALSRVLTTGWVQDLVFADLDQRGNGKSYPAIDPASDMTIDRAVADVIATTEYLRARFDEEKIYLMGESWGTILGVLAVQQRPDLYYAYFGSGQMVDVYETDRRVYADLVEYAEASGNSDLAATLAEVGAPPYRDFPWTNANLLTWYDYLYRDYEPSAGYLQRGTEAGLDPFGVVGTEYSLAEKTTVLRGLIDTFALVYPQLESVDLRESAAKLEVPVYVLDGAAELSGRRDLMLEWYRMLDAPDKQLVTFQDAAHSVAFEQADAVQELFRTEVLPATYP